VAARAHSEEDGQIVEFGSNMLLRPVLTGLSADGMGASACSAGLGGRSRSVLAGPPHETAPVRGS
jgi:hypothetical protein